MRSVELDLDYDKTTAIKLAVVQQLVTSSFQNVIICILQHSSLALSDSCLATCNYICIHVQCT